MKPKPSYLKYVAWSEEDHHFLGYCPDLFPHGAVCHASTEQKAYALLCRLVESEIKAMLKAKRPLPPAQTRPMREAMPACA